MKIGLQATGRWSLEMRESLRRHTVISLTLDGSDLAAFSNGGAISTNCLVQKSFLHR